MCKSEKEGAKNSEHLIDNRIERESEKGWRTDTPDERNWMKGELVMGTIRQQ